MNKGQLKNKLKRLEAQKHNLVVLKQGVLNTPSEVVVEDAVSYIDKEIVNINTKIQFMSII